MKLFKTLVLSLVALAVAPPAIAANTNDQFNRSITVVNRSSRDVIFLNYGATDKDHYYTRDLLGNQIINSGYQIRITVDDGSSRCVYDLKARGQYGAVWRTRMNVCLQDTWTLGD